jgi:hypothetical protein
VVAALAFVYLVVAGVFFPRALGPIDEGLCPGNASLMTDKAGLEAKRDFDGRSYALFCDSQSEVTDATGRWMLLSGSMVVISGLAFVIQAKITPPPLQGPTGPGLR